MAKWTISQYDRLPVDSAGNALPIYAEAMDSDKHTAAGSQARYTGAQYARFCGDTAAHVKVGAGATDADPYVPAGAELVVAFGNEDEISFVAG
jgi:hypothetical protein